MDKFRFAFDLGTTSIGWAVYRLDPATGKPVALANYNKFGEVTSHPPIGVRIFDDGRSADGKKSNAELRQVPRSQRRNIDRRIARRGKLIEELVAADLLPSEASDRDNIFVCRHKGQSCATAEPETCSNPYRLRARASQGEVSRHELGRALWHMSKHRGFKSNRKADKPDDDSGLINSASKELRTRLVDAGHATYGAYLWARLKAGQGVRVRSTGENAAKHYEFYPTRDMLVEEFDRIWAEQAKHHDLSDDLRDQLRNETIFYQRGLKPVLPGRCTFFPEKERLARWHPAAQSFLILQELANLRVIRDGDELQVDNDKRLALYGFLNGGESMTWNAVRKALGLSSRDLINLQEGGLKQLHHNQVASSLIGTKKKPGPLSAQWSGYDTATREKLLYQLAESEDPKQLVAWLEAELKLSTVDAEAVEKVRLPVGYMRFCKDVVEALVYEMKAEAVDYAEAVKNAPLLADADINHSDFRSEHGVDFLPRYNELPVLQRMVGNGTNNPSDPFDKRYGKITNPTVHVALGQFRRIMNALINEYGKPAEVVLEAARDLSSSPKEKDEIIKRIKANEARNDRYRAELEEAGHLKPGQQVGDRFLKMRLWEELGRTPAERCSPFTGRQITLAELHSDAIEIEHILPFAETFDDSPANKTLAFRDENRRKENLSPGEAALRGIFDQAAMIDRTKHLPRNKAWRFLPDAMDVFEEQKGFEDRQLHATGYLARVVRAYAESLFDKVDADGQQRSYVWMLPGRMTAMLRHRWGLNLGDHNRKDRNDHRHHAVDAAVVGVIDRGMIKQLQDAAKKQGAENLSRTLPHPPEPFNGFRASILTAVDAIHVSHRAKHGSADPSNPFQTSGRLHEDTAYGIIRQNPENQADLTIGNVVIRKPVVGLTDKEIGQIRDVKLRHEVLDATAASREAGLSKKEAEKLRVQALTAFAEESGHRRIRVIKAESSARPIRNKDGVAYKYYVPGEVSCIDIIEHDGKWYGHALSVWDANSGQLRTWEQVWPDGKFVMRLHKDDTIQLMDWDDDNDEVVAGSNKIKKVVRLVPSGGRVFMCGISDAGNLQNRHGDEDDDFSWDWPIYEKLRLRRARRVRVDEIGRVHTIPHGKI